jgi:hypothetical protein
MKANYLWEESYQAAILETDREKMPNRIQTAKAAIDDRLHGLQMDHGGTTEERYAISDALAALNVLRREVEQRFSRNGSEVNGNPGWKSGISDLPFLMRRITALWPYVLIIFRWRDLFISFGPGLRLSPAFSQSDSLPFIRASR